jgi:hypothetical protein
MTEKTLMRVAVAALATMLLVLVLWQTGAVQVGSQEPDYSNDDLVDAIMCDDGYVAACLRHVAR